MAAGRVRRAPGTFPPYTGGLLSAHEGPGHEDCGGVTTVASGGAAGQDGADLADGLGVHSRTRHPAGLAQRCSPSSDRASSTTTCAHSTPSSRYSKTR
jgi:hypothetical protein